VSGARRSRDLADARNGHLKTGLLQRSMVGLMQATVAPLQRLQNSASRLIFELSTREHVTPCLVQLHWLGLYVGASSSNCAASCTPSFMGRVQRICWTLSSPLVQTVHAPAFSLLHPQTSHCHSCAPSSANVRSVTPVVPHGTTCLKTQQSSESSWRLTALLAPLILSDF